MSKIGYYFIVAKEAEWAEDNEGSPTEAYLAFEIETEKPVTQEECEKCYQGNLTYVGEYLSDTFNLKPEYLTPISYEEYKELS